MNPAVLEFFGELPWHPPLFTTPKGDSAVHLMAEGESAVVSVRWLASIQRGAGRAALTIIVEAADRNGITLELTAKPQPGYGAGKLMTPAELEAFYAGFGFVTIRRRDGFAWMVRQPGAGLRPPRP